MRIIFSFLILISSFANGQDSTSKKEKKAPPEEYIIKKDSTKIIGNLSRKKNKIFLNGVEYQLSDILGFKEGNHYHAVFDNSIYWVWALGKIQAYSQWETYNFGSTYDPNTNIIKSNSSTYSECYLRKDSGKMIGYSTRNLYDLIKDNEEAVKEFNSNYRKINDYVPADMLYRKLRKVLAVYNGNTVTTY